MFREGKHCLTEPQKFSHCTSALIMLGLLLCVGVCAVPALMDLDVNRRDTVSLAVTRGHSIRPCHCALTAIQVLS